MRISKLHVPPQFEPKELEHPTIAINLITNKVGEVSFIEQLKSHFSVVVVPTNKESTAYWQAASRYAGNQGMRVFPFEWCDDFAAARNHALKHTTAHWVLWLDDDDIITPETEKMLKSKAFRKLLTLQDKMMTVRVRAGKSDNYFDQLRIFPNVPGIMWDGKLHETIEASLIEFGIKNKKVISDIQINHTGYDSDELHKEKQLRNIRILNTMPPSLRRSYYLGISYAILDNTAKALRYFLEASQDFENDKDMAAEIAFRIAQLLIRHGAADMALSMLKGHGSADCLFMSGDILWDMEDRNSACVNYHAAINKKEPCLRFQSHRNHFEPRAKERMVENGNEVIRRADFVSAQA